MIMPPLKKGYIALLMSVGRYVGRQTKWFPLIILNTIYHRVVIFQMQIGHDQQMTPIDSGVTKLKVKVRGRICRSTFLVFYILHKYFFIVIRLEMKMQHCMFTLASSFAGCHNFTNTTEAFKSAEVQGVLNNPEVGCGKYCLIVLTLCFSCQFLGIDTSDCMECRYK